MMQESLPKSEAVDKFWMYWREPTKFIQKYPGDYYYIIYYKKGHEIHMVPAKDDKELEKIEKELGHKGYKIIQEKIVPSPELLKEIVGVVLKTASSAGLISIKLPIAAKPLLFSEGEAHKIIFKLKAQVGGT